MATFSYQKTDVLFCFPHQWHPNHPPLAPTLLMEGLHKASITYRFWDANLEVYQTCFKPEFLKTCYNRITMLVQDVSIKQKNKKNAVQQHTLLNNALHAYPYLYSLAESWQSSMTFFSEQRVTAYYRVYHEMQALLKFVSLAYPPMKLGLGFLSFDPPPDSLNHLNQLVNDPSSNLYWHVLSSTLLKKVQQHNPCVIAFSVGSDTQLVCTCTLLTALKQQGYDGQTLIGGSFFTRFWSEPEKLNALRQWVDHIICFEGERSFVQSVQALLNHCKPHLDILPSEPGGFHTPRFQEYPLQAYFNPKLVIPYLTSRGCYHHQCIFCERPGYDSFGRDRFYQQPPKQVISDLRVLQKQLNSSFFSFIDEALHPTYLDALSDAILKADLSIKWICYGRFDEGYSKSLLEKCYKAGLRKIWFGFEAGSERILRRMRKHILPAIRDQVITDCLDVGIGIHLFVIVGFPSETQQEFEQGIQHILAYPGLVRHPFFSYDLFPFYVGHAGKARLNPSELGIRIHTNPNKEWEFNYRYSYLDGTSKAAIVKRRKWAAYQLDQQLHPYGLGQLKTPQDFDHLVLIDAYEQGLPVFAPVRETDPPYTPQSYIEGFRDRDSNHPHLLNLWTLRSHPIQEFEYQIFQYLKEGISLSEMEYRMGKEFAPLIMRSIQCLEDLGYLKLYTPGKPPGKASH